MTKQQAQEEMYILRERRVALESAERILSDEIDKIRDAAHLLLCEFPTLSLTARPEKK